MCLKKERGPTTKQFDDDEWIRSLTEAQKNPTDISRKIASRKGSSEILALSEGEIAALTTAMRQIGVGTQGGAEALASFHQLLYDEVGRSFTDRTAGQNQSRRKKTAWE